MQKNHKAKAVQPLRSKCQERLLPIIAPGTPTPFVGSRKTIHSGRSSTACTKFNKITIQQSNNNDRK